MLTHKSFQVINRQVCFAVDSHMGGYQNEIADGVRQRHQLPCLVDLVNEVYTNVTTMGYDLGAEGLPVCSEVEDCDENVLKGIIAWEIMNGHFDF